MGISPAVFESAGKRTEHYIPGSYSRSMAVGGAGSISAGNLAILGKAKAGKPDTLFCFTNLSDANDALEGGDLLKAIGYAFENSTEYKPQRVYAMVVNKNTNAARTFKASTTEVLKAWTAKYGAGSNQVSMQLAAGTTTGTRKVIATVGENTTTIDNIGQKCFSLQYTGTGAAASMAITATQLTVTITSSEGGSEGTTDSVTVDFETYATIGEVIARLNEKSCYAAVSNDVDSVASNLLDVVTGQDVKTAAVDVKADFAALVDAINSLECIEKTEKLAGNTMPDNDTEAVYFEGGSAGTYTTTDWNDALSALEAENIQIVTTPSEDSVVHGLIANHCKNMSSVVNRKERTCFLGGGKTETVDEATARAKTFNADTVSYCFPGVSVNSPLSGETEELGGSYFAVMCAGMESAVAVNMPLTNKVFKVNSFLKKLKVAEMETLIAGGVLCGGFNVDEELVCIRAMTTYQGNELQLCERSMVREDFYMNRDLRSRFNGSIGQPDTTGGGDVSMTLAAAAMDWEAAGMIIRNAENQKLVWDVSQKVSGDKTWLYFSRNLVSPRNFVFITVKNYVYEASTSLSI